MQPRFALQQRVGAEPRDLEDGVAVRAVAADPHPSAVGPAHIHRLELLDEPLACVGIVRVAGTNGERRVARLARIEARERCYEHVEPDGQELHELPRVPFPLRAQTCAEPLRSRRRRAQPVEVLDQTEHSMSVLRLPEGRVARLFERVHLCRVPGARPLRHPRELTPEEGCFDLGTLRIERDPCERELAVRHGSGGGRDLRIRIDERHVEPGALPRRDEEELVAFGELALDDRGRDPGQHVLLHGPLQRPRAELGAEALLDQEVDRRLVPLDRPRPHPEAAPPEHVRQLLLEQAAHDLAPERAEDDDPVEAVEELRPERAGDRLDHVRGVEPAGAAGEADARAARDRRAEVRGEDDHAVA